MLAILFIFSRPRCGARGLVISERLSPGYPHGLQFSRPRCGATIVGAVYTHGFHRGLQFLLPPMAANSRGRDAARRLWGPCTPTVDTVVYNSCCRQWRQILAAAMRRGILGGRTSPRRHPLTRHLRGLQFLRPPRRSCANAGECRLWRQLDL